MIRLAGTIVAPSQIGSVERFGRPLVVVLSDSMFGMVQATLDELESHVKDRSSNVLSIVNRIRPSMAPLFETELRQDPERLLDAAIRANILASTNHLRHGSPLLEQLIQQGGLTIVCAKYSLETGQVDCFDGSEV